MMLKRPDFTFNEWQALSDQIYKALPEWLAFILSAYLWGLEQRYIDWKVKTTVDNAIAPHRPSEPSLREPTYTSSPSEVEGLDIISYSYDFDPPEKGGEKRMP